MRVLVYSDEGVYPYGFRQLMKALKSYKVQSVDHRYLIDSNWEESTTLLVIPGGRDIPYHTHLQGVGNQRIKAFVQNGGTYLGICAGGYYGAASVEFEKGGELEVCANRELAFFPGRAVGPAYGLGQFSYGSEKGAHTAQLHWEGGESPVYFNGGCFFEGVEAYPSTHVLARYNDLPGAPAAVIRCPLGRGCAILSGVHPEYTLPPSLDPQREAFWKYLLSHFFCPF